MQHGTGWRSENDRSCNLLEIHMIVYRDFIMGNKSGANQSLRANHTNFDPGHWINIQGEGRRG